MAWLRRLANGVQAMVRRKQGDAEMDEELRDFVEKSAAAKMQTGLTRQQALREARMEMGSMDSVKEKVRAVGWETAFNSFWQDIRFAFRMLRKSPGFTAVAILTLALGIGANTAIFSFIDAVLLRSLPVKDPQQLVAFSWSAHGKPNINGHDGYGDCERASSIGSCSFSLPFFHTIDAQAKTFSGMAAFSGPIDVDLSGNGPASIARGLYVSGDFFSTLGVNAFIGRPLTPSDDTPSAPPAIVLNYAYWVRAFGGDRSVIGRTLQLDNTVATIVGVSDPRFTNLTPGKVQDFFMPLSLAETVRNEWGHVAYLTDARTWWVVMLGRLKNGVSIGQAQAAATTIYRNEMLHGSKPMFTEADAPVIHLALAQAGLNGYTTYLAPALYVTMIIVVFILLIACANVAGLTLARSATRQKEMAVRLALGAGRTRIIRQLLTESILLSVAGGVLGIFFAIWGVDAISKLLAHGPESPFPFIVAPDWRVLTFAIVVTFITGILFGLTPAMRGSRIDLTPSLKESASSLPGAVVHTKRWFRLGDALVIAQVALSIIVLIGAGLLVRTLRNLQTLNPGFDARNILLFRLDPSIAGFTDQQTQQLYGNLQERLAALPGVISVSYSEDALLAGGTSGDRVHLDGAPPKQNLEVLRLPVGLNFFSTMRIPILAGRGFTSADFAAAIANHDANAALSAASAKARTATEEAYDRSAPVPVMINESFARKYLPNRNPVGVHLGGAQYDDYNVQHPGPGYTIIGVVGDTKYAQLRTDVAPILFEPLMSDEAHFELRTATNPAALVKSVRGIVWRVASDLPVTDVRTQTEQIEDMLIQERLMSRLSGFFGALALVLACIGLYGLLSYEVTRRTRELGIRMALGAQRRDLLRLVVGQGVLLVLIGTVVGVAGALGVTRFMSSMLYGIHADDPLTFVGVAVLLTFVALAACYIPARRAMRVEPMEALRYE